MADIIRILSSGQTAEMTLNGLDVSKAVTGYSIQQSAGEAPRVHIQLRVLPDFEGAADVSIPDETRAALVALGWTAPPFN
jgi:hypothetical protein